VVVPDWKVPLTRKGHQDAMLAGAKIKEIVGEKPLYVYCSPYMRTKQTLARIVECLDGNVIVGVREEPRLTEQVGG
jgi:phosphohistidine phosphatase SixA